jgi:hypothetical protein
LSITGTIRSCCKRDNHDEWHLYLRFTDAAAFDSHADIGGGFFGMYASDVIMMEKFQETLASLNEYPTFMDIMLLTRSDGEARDLDSSTITRHLHPYHNNTELHTLRNIINVKKTYHYEKNKDTFNLAVMFIALRANRVGIITG